MAGGNSSQQRQLIQKWGAQNKIIYHRPHFTENIKYKQPGTGSTDDNHKHMQRSEPRRSKPGIQAKSAQWTERRHVFVHTCHMVILMHIMYKVERKG